MLRSHSSFITRSTRRTERFTLSSVIWTERLTLSSVIWTERSTLSSVIWTERFTLSSVIWCKRRSGHSLSGCCCFCFWIDAVGSSPLASWSTLISRASRISEKALYFLFSFSRSCTTCCILLASLLEEMPTPSWKKGSKILTTVVNHYHYASWNCVEGIVQWMTRWAQEHSILSSTPGSDWEFHWEVCLQSHYLLAYWIGIAVDVFGHANVLGVELDSYYYSGVPTENKTICRLRFSQQLTGSTSHLLSSLSRTFWSCLFMSLISFGLSVRASRSCRLFPVRSSVPRVLQKRGTGAIYLLTES